MNTSTNHHEYQSILSAAAFHAVALAVVAVGGIYGWQQEVDGSLLSSLYLFVYVHMAFSIARGHLRGDLAWTWVLLVLGLVVSEAISFVDFFMPPGQIAALIAQLPAAGPYIERFTNNMNVIGLNYDAAGSLFLLGLAGLNIGARFKLSQTGIGINERVLALGALWVLIVLVGTSLFDGANTGDGQLLATPTQIVPEWYLLPFYAVLRAIPSKEAGVAAMFVFIAIPVLAIFIGNARSKGAGIFALTLQLCALFSFVGLGYLGAQAVDVNVLLATRVLAFVYVLYFVFAALFTTKPEPA